MFLKRTSIFDHKQLNINFIPQKNKKNYKEIAIGEMSKVVNFVLA